MLVTLFSWLLFALTIFGAGYSFLRRRKVLNPRSAEARKAQGILDLMPVEIRQALDYSIVNEKQWNMIKTLRKEFGLNLHEALDVIHLAQAFHRGQHA
jgi:predicted nucleic acid-binding protein